MTSMPPNVLPSRLSNHTPWIETQHWWLMPVDPIFAPEQVRYIARNEKRFLSAMSIDKEMEKTAFWSEAMTGQQEGMKNQLSVNLLGFLKDSDGSKIGCNIDFVNIIHDDFQACTVGLKIDYSLEGLGLMHEAMEASINQIFSHFRLHRIMACHLPENIRSAKVLRRLGFVVEGYARDFVKVNGKWCDNILLSLLHPDAI
jgi:ribosomal-protein-alanine N-acetyltransferase